MNTQEIREKQADRLDECLKMRKMTQADLIREYYEQFHLEIPSSHMSMIKKAKRSLPHDYAIAFSEYLRIDSGYLLGIDNFTAANYQEYELILDAEKAIPEHRELRNKYGYYLQPVRAKIVNTITSDEPSEDAYIKLNYKKNNVIVSATEMDAFNKEVEKYIEAALTHLMLKHKYD